MSECRVFYIQFQTLHNFSPKGVFRITVTTQRSNPFPSLITHFLFTSFSKRVLVLNRPFQMEMSLICKTIYWQKSSFQYERLYTKIRVETEVGATLKWLIKKCKDNTE